jgi:hypothetical protein
MKSTTSPVIRPAAVAALASLFLLSRTVFAVDREMPAGVAIGGYTGPKASLLAIDDYSLPLRKDSMPLSSIFLGAITRGGPSGLTAWNGT